MIGRLIDGRYQVRSRIARGGMATVYLATDLRLERRVAVKVMHGHLADDSQFKQRFIQEARSAARLAHPNVVNVFDQGQDSESAYLVMEYLPGITLRDLLEEYGSLTPQQAIDISEAVLNGLSAAHKAGIIHRDLKPENVLLADDGRIKIGDFGLARAATANTATGAQLLGTIAYLSPELVTRGVADTRSDIYAVGIMMYEMLTGEQPFTGDQPMQIAYRHANEDVPAPSLRNPRVPQELDELVQWATAKDPDQRPDDARVLLEQVRDTEKLLDLPTGPTAVTKTQVLPPAPGGSRRATGPTGPAPRRPNADAATQVLGARGAVAGELERVEVSPAPPRRRRRWIPLLAILAALALVGGGLGWWFGFGPGASVTIPAQIEGMTEQEARDLLTDLGLVVSETNGELPHPTVPIGDVAQTDPKIGESVAKGSSVTLRISTGPQMYDITFERGMARADAEAMTEHFTALPEELRFDAEVPRDTLIDAIAVAADETESSLLGVAQYGDQQEIRLVFSAGSLPSVAGQELETARQMLAAVDLTADPASDVLEHSDDVPSGQVIGLVLEEGAIVRPGETVVLKVSQGPAPTTVPEIVGMTWTQAREALMGAGLGWEFARTIDRVLAESAPNEAVVTSVEPEEGASVLRKDVVRVRLGAN